ncbi:unnamed protein product [Caenorhabditis bovis]|uniref:Uncharacterized protein n=1 Tax=Caenorhabditis bovis TaxID=2654633 RepID=A0A8S1FCS6_9PELO|nr:unnamed protein product [Caenorhabditis bovis]
MIINGAKLQCCCSLTPPIDYKRGAKYPLLTKLNMDPRRSQQDQNPPAHDQERSRSPSPENADTFSILSGRVRQPIHPQNPAPAANSATVFPSSVTMTRGSRPVEDFQNFQLRPSFSHESTRIPSPTTMTPTRATESTSQLRQPVSATTISYRTTTQTTPMAEMDSLVEKIHSLVPIEEPAPSHLGRRRSPTPSEMSTATTTFRVAPGSTSMDSVSTHQRVNMALDVPPSSVLPQVQTMVLPNDSLTGAAVVIPPQPVPNSLREAPENRRSSTPNRGGANEPRRRKRQSFFKRFRRSSSLAPNQPQNNSPEPHRVRAESDAPHFLKEAAKRVSNLFRRQSTKMEQAPTSSQANVPTPMDDGNAHESGPNMASPVLQKRKSIPRAAKDKANEALKTRKSNPTFPQQEPSTSAQAQKTPKRGRNSNDDEKNAKRKKEGQMSDRSPSPPVNHREMTLAEKRRVHLHFLRLRVNAEVDEVQQFLHSVFNGEEESVLIDPLLSKPYFFFSLITDVDATIIPAGTTFNFDGVSRLLEIRARNVELTRPYLIVAENDVWVNAIHLVSGSVIYFSVYLLYLNYPNYVVEEEFMENLVESVVHSLDRRNQ